MAAKNRFMYHFTALLMISLGCERPSLPAAPPAPKVVSSAPEQALTFIKQLEKSPEYRMGIPDYVSQEMAAKHLDQATLLRGALEILQTGAKAERQQAARFLGRLRDQSALGPLVRALDDPNQDVRTTASYALLWLDAKGEPAESALAKLRRAWPAVGVRGAAAIALERHADPETAAFKLGLPADECWIREGRLLLPEETYKWIDSKESLDLGMRDLVRRQVRKGDTLFFEVEEGHPDRIPTFHYWYRMKISPDQSK